MHGQAVNRSMIGPCMIGPCKPDVAGQDQSMVSPRANHAFGDNLCGEIKQIRTLLPTVQVSVDMRSKCLLTKVTCIHFETPCFRLVFPSSDAIKLAA